MSVSTETAYGQTEVLVQDGSFLVLNSGDGSGEEVLQTEDGLKCSCLIAQVFPDGICDHVKAVREYLATSSIEMTISQADADYYLGRVKALDRSIAGNNDSAEQQRQRIQIWLDSENEKLERRKRYYLLSLENWLHSTGDNSRNLVHGRIQYRKQPLKVEILDEETVRSDERFQRIVPEHVEIDRKALRQYVQQTGEEPEGVRVTVPGPKFSYKLEKGL